MAELQKRRTIKTAFETIKALDPDTPISMRYVREITPHLAGTIHRGNKWLLLFDELIEYLNEPFNYELVQDGDRQVYRRKQGNEVF